VSFRNQTAGIVKTPEIQLARSQYVQKCKLVGGDLRTLPVRTRCLNLSSTVRVARAPRGWQGAPCELPALRFDPAANVTEEVLEVIFVRASDNDDEWR